MRFFNKYNKTFLLFFICLPIPFKTVLSDVIITTENENIVCVVVERDAETLSIVTKNGKRTLSKKDIRDIEIGQEKDNLLLLAEFASANNDNFKAYYLYEKVLEMDPDSGIAIKGLTLMEKSLKGDDSDKKWVQNYERFYEKVSPEKSEKSVLNDNSIISEQLMENFGLILISENDKIKVSEVIYNSKGYRSEFQINDFIISVGDIPVDYLGLYDTILELNKRKSDIFNVRIERDLRVWNEGEKDTLTDSLKFKDYSLSILNGSFVFSEVKSDTSVFNAGIRVGDRLVGIKGVSVSSSTDPVRLSRIIRNTGSEFIDIVVQKVLTVD